MSRRWPILLAVVALALAACGGGEEEEAGPAPEAEEPAGEIPADAQAFTVAGTEFAFDPAEFTVEAGRPVAVTFVNEGAVEHDWVLFTGDGQEVAGTDIDALAGQEATTVFTLEPGTYRAVCTLPGHEEAGMVGQVVAE